MTILVTGATGFVGLNIAEALLARGANVILFANAPLPPGAEAELRRSPGSMTVLTGDVCVRADLNRAFAWARPEQVVHAAALTPGAEREHTDGRRTVEVNVLGTWSTLEAARDHGVRRVVLVSSGAVYGRNAFDGPVLDEANTPPAPEGIYPTTKLAAEQLGLRFGAVWEMDVLACRLSSVFGPWERDTGMRETLSPILQVTRLALAGRRAVLPRPGPRDWIYSRDVADGVLALLEARAPAHRLYNIGPGVTWTVADWCALLVEALPGFSFRCADASTPPNVDYHAAGDRAPLSVERLTSDLGFRARFGLHEAFADYLAWLRAHPTAQL